MKLYFKDTELKGIRWTGSNLKEVQDFLNPVKVGFSDGFIVIESCKVPENVVIVKLPSGDYTILHDQFVKEVCRPQTADAIFKDNSIRIEKVGVDGYLFPKSISIDYLRKVLREGDIDKCEFTITTDNIILRLL